MKTKDKQRREWKRSGKMTEHHLTPSSRGGETIGSNLFKLDGRRHEAWHLLFSNLTLEEVIVLLTKIQHIKESQRFEALL